MKKIWDIVNKFNVTSVTKTKLFLGIQSVVNALIGALLWVLAGRLLLPGIDWLICFIGYPAWVFGPICGIIYLYNHEF